MASVIQANPPKPPRTFVSQEQQNGEIDVQEEEEQQNGDIEVEAEEKQQNGELDVQKSRKDSASSASSKSSTPESVAPSIIRESSADELEEWQRTDEERKPDVNTEELLKVF